MRGSTSEALTAAIDCAQCGARHAPNDEADGEQVSHVGRLVCRDCGAVLQPSVLEGALEPTASSTALSSPAAPAGDAAATLADGGDALDRDTTPDAMAPALERQSLSDALTPVKSTGAPERDDARDVAPDSALPIESADFIHLGRPVPKPPRKHQAERDTDVEPPDFTLPDPFMPEPLPAAPAPERDDAPRADAPRTEAPVARTTRPPNPHRTPRHRVTAALLLGLLGALALRFALNERADSKAPRGDSTPASALQAPVAAALPAPLEIAQAPVEAPSVAAAEPSATPQRAAPAANAVVATPAAARLPPGPSPAPAVAPPSGSAAASDSAAPNESGEAVFDAAAAGIALDEAARRARSCRKGNDPSGMAVVTITFAGSGKATSANVSGPPFAGTETGGCIAAALRGARVPAFSGDFVTVKKTLVID